MNNRVDYLSDRLVNLRGKHKSVDEVIPPDSIANGVSIAPAVQKAAQKTASNTISQAALAQERRLQQVMQLHSDFEQRLTRRKRQTELQIAEFEQKLAGLKELQKSFADYEQVLANERFSDDDELTASLLGERYRTLDRTRLEFFQTEAELDQLVKSQGTPAAVMPEVERRDATFGEMYKKGLAEALTVGFTIALAIIVAALIICAAWG